MIYAKSDKTELTKHLIDVSIESIKLYRSQVDNPTTKDEKIIKISSLLHDIGKATDGFQNMINGGKNTNKYQHQHISWAFVANICNIDMDLRDSILNIIFWHHGTQQYKPINSSDILQTIKPSCIERMVDIAKGLSIDINDNYLDNYLDNYEESPNYYQKLSNITHGIQTNSKLIHNRLCVVLGDRIASGMNYDENYKGNNLNFDICPFPTQERFITQKEVIVNTDKTTVIKAPTGYGKTMMGLLWYEKTNKKTLWVCPRNTVAISTYNSILKELKNANKHLNVKLCYENTTKQTNYCDLTKEADIIVTNVDYYLRPYSNGGKDMTLLMFMLGANVVFDEYHELVSDSPLFSLFVSLMYIRNNILNSETLLLSGTPIDLSFLWDTISKRTKQLPNNENHLPAIHEKKYEITINNEKVKNINNDELFFTNTIKNSQKYAKEFGNCLLIHSDFSEADYKERLEILDLTYGKGNTATNKIPFLSTLVLEAALDISFKKVYDTPISPERTLQRIGRCNRWGEKENGKIEIIIESDYNRGNVSIIDTLYSSKLNQKWVETLKTLNNTQITLDELYKLYNKFNSDNKNDIKTLIKNKFNTSSNQLSDNVYPIKYNYSEEETDRKIFKASTNKFRSDGSEIFYIVKDNATNEWVGPFSEKIRKDFQTTFKEKSNVFSDIIKIYKKEMVQNNNFDYGPINENSYIKNITLDTIRYKAKLNISPYIALNFEYDKNLGVLK